MAAIFPSDRNLQLSDITTGNVSATKHGFCPKFPNNTTTFLRGDGTYAAPAGSGKFDLLSTASPSAVATVDFTFTGWTNSDYFAYKMVLERLAPATDNVSLYLRTSSDGGSSYDSGASTYDSRYGRFGASLAQVANDNATQIVLNSGLGNASEENTNGEITIINPSAAAYCQFTWLLGSYATDGTFVGCFGGGRRKNGVDVDAVRLLFSSGNIASGTIKIYGIKAA